MLVLVLTENAVATENVEEICCRGQQKLHREVCILLWSAISVFVLSRRPKQSEKERAQYFSKNQIKKEAVISR